jgi:hypothetical protein
MTVNRTRRSILFVSTAAAALLSLEPAHHRVFAQATSAERKLEVAPIVGHWTHHDEAGESIVTVDGTTSNKSAVADPAAVAKRLFKQPAAAFAANATSSGAFPAAAVMGIENFTGGRAQVQFKLVKGLSDQIAGLIFDLRATGEYLVIRYNTKDGNVALWKYADGARSRVAEGTDHAQLPLGTWHTIELHVADRQLTGTVNGKLRVEHTLHQPVSGRIGFWAKPDSVSSFKALRVQ